MEGNSSQEEGFLDFCDRIATDNGFFVKLKRRSEAKKEWRALDPITKRDIMSMARAIDGTGQAAAEAREISETKYRGLARLPKRSRIRRMKYLDPVETAALNSLEKCKDAIQEVDLVLGDLTAPHIARTTVLPQLLTTWSQAARSFLALQKKSLATVQRDLHGLKRRTPGRKIMRYCTREQMESLSRRHIDRPPAFARPPPKTRPSKATRWHCRDLGTKMGGINRGVHISIGTDQNGMIVDRTVRKTVVLQESWDWCDNLPIEFMTQAALSSLSDARFVLRTEKWPEPRGRNLYSLYLEFAPHGDLFQLAINHQKANRWVPEEFLWLLFQSLIESTLLMKCGSDRLGGPSPPDWQEIVHRDLKPENIVLGLPVQGHFQLYPRPKLADFGGAIFTTQDDAVNPDFYATFGTPGLTPPEQLWYIDPESGKPVDRFPVLSPCNVWGIGAVMYNMMTLGGISARTQPPYVVTRPIDQPEAGPSIHISRPGQTFDAMDIDAPSDPGYETPDEARPVPSDVVNGPAFRYTLRPSVKTRYDPELCDMVNKCLSFHPDSRPKIEDLKEWVDEQFRKKTRLKDLNAGRKVVGREPETALYESEKEEYKIGMHWSTLRVMN